MDKIILLSITIGIIILIYIVIMYFIFMLSFVKLFEKEKYNKTHAYIPLYNFYLYFKLLKLPAFLVFIPIINIIAIAFSPYNLSRRYGYSVNESWLSVLLPFIYVPRIANSDKKNIFYEHDNDFVTSSEDIDMLEKKLESESSDIINDINEYKPITTEEHPVDSIKVLEESIDNTTDEIIYDEIEEKSTPEITKQMIQLKY